jgi:hypothetical protein
LNTIETTARQGDVMLVRVGALPSGLRPVPRDAHGRIVLAYGESSGHAHALRDPHVCGFHVAGAPGPDDDPSGVWGGVSYIEVGGSAPATLSHEYASGQLAEHHPVTLPPGVYKVELQQEYRPGAIVRVAD